MLLSSYIYISQLVYDAMPAPEYKVGVKTPRYDYDQVVDS